MSNDRFEWRAAQPAKSGWASFSIGFVCFIGAVWAFVVYGAPYLSSSRPQNTTAAVEEKPAEDPIARVLTESAPRAPAPSASPPSGPASTPAPSAEPARVPAPPPVVLNAKPDAEEPVPGKDASPSPSAGDERIAPSIETNDPPASANDAPATQPRDSARARDRASRGEGRSRIEGFRDIDPERPRGRAAREGDSKDFRSLRESVLREALGGGR